MELRKIEKYLVHPLFLLPLPLFLILSSSVNPTLLFFFSSSLRRPYSFLLITTLLPFGHDDKVDIEQELHTF